MAKQLNPASKSSTQKVPQDSDQDKLNELFRQVTHDIRVPVTGLKMLWPMIDEVEGAERKEVFDYLRMSSYELFELIENLALVLTDYELLHDKPQSTDLKEIIATAFAQDRSAMDIINDDLPDGTFPIRPKHFKQCLDLSLELCKEISDGHEVSEIQVKGHLADEKIILVFTGPSVAVEGDKYSTRIHFSLFKKSKGNSKLSGFTLLRLRTLMNMVEGTLQVETLSSHSSIILRFPLN